MTSTPDSAPQPQRSARKGNWTPRPKKRDREVTIYRCAYCLRMSGLRGMPPLVKLNLPNTKIYVHGHPLRCGPAYLMRHTRPDAVSMEDIERAIEQRHANA